MAKIIWSGPEAFDINQFDFSWGLAVGKKSNTTRGATKYVVKYSAGDRDEYFGSGFKYDSKSKITAGTIKKLVGYDNNKKIGEISGVKVDVAEVLKVFKTKTTSDDRALYAKVFAGSDTITGGKNKDKLEGFAGNDRITGGLGADKLYGGAGSDTFVFTSVKDSTVSTSGRDTIYDFSSKQKDRLDFKAIDANTKVAGNQAFSFIGTKAFQKKAGQLRYEKASGGVTVHGDVDGDGKADFSVHLKSITALSKADFIL